MVLDYEAVINGQADPAPVDEFDLITYLRPSRYCESDTLAPTAASQFAGLTDQELLAAVGRLGGRPAQLCGRIEPADRRCGPHPARAAGRLPRFRPSLHRAAPRAQHPGSDGRRLRPRPEPDGVPRGLRGVSSAGAWYVVDATRQAPRQSLVRVATGRDAADTAFLTNLGGGVTLNDLQVTAVVDDFGTDDGSQLIQLR